ncbi:hypothetical protein [Sinorhizobium terangae]|uniref:hypothetical protein n=1 Tax=Sinorhizobium terangae TaxID=110322 RepID=UPI0024B1AE7F|nr:hypothetical protein [Sinorhizobium terangae]WFU49132.1 hypothetical protein QA637_06960 [Sinorhizobium terangae]
MTDLRNAALSKAKKAVRSPQQQISYRLFKMADEVEGGKDSSARRVGNAVPPVIGQVIRLAARSALTGKDFDYSIVLREAASSEDLGLRLHVEAPTIVPSLPSKELSPA